MSVVRKTEAPPAEIAQGAEPPINPESLSIHELVRILRGVNREMLMKALESVLQAEECTSNMASAAKRRSLRSRALRSGKIIYNNRTSVVDCQIRDMSVTGCRLRFAANTASIPRYFSLHIIAGDQKHECEIVWRTASELGIKYIA